ncbi:MAG TPA: O-antigen ligase family protein [Syntrophorhabdales bacterium]|nr:O-antigen ligase family protein [Syntrophorhabdales bacterium]
MDGLHTIASLRDTRWWLFWAAVVLGLGVFWFIEGHDLLWGARDWTEVTEASVQVEEGSAPRRVSLLILGAFGVFSLLRRERKPWHAQSLLTWLALFFLLWALISLAWTEDVGMTFRRLLVLAMFCLGAIGLAESFSVPAIVLMVFVVTGVYLTVGFAAEAALGTFLPLDPDYRFAGTMHPNHQGMNCALLLVSALFLAKHAKRMPRALVLSAAGVAFVFLFLTKSRASLGGAILSLLVYWALVVPGSRKGVLLLVAGIISIIIIFFLGDILFYRLGESMLLGRSDDPDSVSMLTGRIPLWKVCIEQIAMRPFQGYGYGAFWTPQHIYEISASEDWGVAEAHSAYVELALGVGLMGAITWVLILFFGIRRAFARGEVLENSGHHFLGVLLLFSALDGVLESGPVGPTLLYLFNIVAVLYLGFYQARAVAQIKGT